MPATRLTISEVRSVRRTHSASIPAYLMRDDGSVLRIWPSGKIERIDTLRGGSLQEKRDRRPDRHPNPPDCRPRTW